MPKNKQKYTGLFNHKLELENSVKCGCAGCRSTFDYEEITNWTENGQTALCPNCGEALVAGFDSHFIVINDNLMASYRKYIYRNLMQK